MLGSGDLTLGRRKFSGSAQRRLREHILVHASLLYDFALDRIGRYTLMPPRRPDYRGGRSHEEFVTNLPLPRHKPWPPHAPRGCPTAAPRPRRPSRRPWSRLTWRENFPKLDGSSDFDRIHFSGATADRSA